MLPTEFFPIVAIKLLAAGTNGKFPTELVSIAVAVIAAFGAWAAQRAAARASTVSSRMDAEKEAYERARALDTQTINRLKEENEELRDTVEDLKAQVKLCNSNIKRLQDRFPISLQGLEGQLRERLKEESRIDQE